MPRFLAPQPRTDAKRGNTGSQESEHGLGALNSGSSPLPGYPDTLTVKSKSTLETPPPVHPSSSRTTPQLSGIRVDEIYNEEPEGETSESPHNAEQHAEKERLAEPQIGDEDDVPQEPLEDLAEEELSEEQLRKLFEDEEIERFLRHFNAHVQEVRLPTTKAPAAVLSTETSQTVVTASDNSQRNVLLPTTENSPGGLLKLTSDLDDSEDTEDSVWSMVGGSYLPSGNERPADESPDSPGSPTLSEMIARKYLLPNLPPLQPNPDHRFTIGRARLQAERFNLVTHPAYGPFFARLWGYASWKDRRTSMWHCAVFWVLWFFDLLLPALFAIILYTLFRRRIFSYPTLKELRDRRYEAARAVALGEEVENRFATGPDFGMRDAWNLFRSITKGKKKGQRNKKKSGKEEAGEKVENPATVQVRMTEGDGAVVKIDALGESQAEKDIKRAILQAMTEIADLHERIKNIFLWRRPQVSRKYAMAFAFLFLVTLVLPAKYLAKLTYFAGGFFFWFVPPVILGLPANDRARFPPAFADAPTDAQYAMEMIALRVARGESVVPARPKSAKQRKASKAAADDTDPLLHDKDAQREAIDKEVDWRKWGERAARGFAWAEEGKRVLKGDMQPLRQGARHQANTSIPPASGADGNPSVEIEISTYPAQYTSGPGLLTLNSTTLSFTQVLSSKPKVQIRLDHIRGVKKAGKMGGLTLKWGESDGEEKEEKFRWVGGRDEVFAKLVGWRGRNWIHI